MTFSMRIQAIALCVITLFNGVVSYGGREYSNQGVYDFVYRMYEVVLGRNPDPDGLDFWYNYLTNGNETAANVAYGFFFSNEYVSKNKSNDEYLNDLYSAMFGRNPDTDGYNTWISRLDYGVPRVNIFKGFVDSAEFLNLCNNYGVVKGTVSVNPRDDNYYYAHMFVSRFYTNALYRDPDPDGLRDWKEYLVSGRITGTELAYGFVFSPECMSNTEDNGAFVRVLYRCMLGREPDPDGFNTWVGMLNSGSSREEIFAGFVNSAEFAALCSEYHITKGEFRLGRAIDPNRPMIALTFDDGPSAQTTRILNALEQHGAVATFFVVGTNASAYPSLIARADAMGCEIGNHTTNHPSLTSLSATGVAAEINSCESSIIAACGHGSSVMRPPYGNYNDTVRGNVGRPLILWSLDTRDWQSRNTQSVVNNVLSNVRDGDVILMHDLYSSTAGAAEILIPELINRGYQLVTVSELAEYRGGMAAGQAYRSFRP